jgi:hypothetical protein
MMMHPKRQGSNPTRRLPPSRSDCLRGMVELQQLVYLSGACENPSAGNKRPRLAQRDMNLVQDNATPHMSYNSSHREQCSSDTLRSNSALHIARGAKGKLQCSGMWRRAVWYTATETYLEGGGRMFFRNVGTYLQNYMASRSENLVYLNTDCIRRYACLTTNHARDGRWTFITVSALTQFDPSSGHFWSVIGEVASGRFSTSTSVSPDSSHSS